MAENVKLDNTRNLLRNKGSRNRILWAFGVVALMVVGGLYFGFSGHKKVAAPPASASVTPPPQVQSIPGTSTNQDYQKLQAQKNQQAFEQAEQTHSSAIPVLTGSIPAASDPMSKVNNPPVNPPAQPTQNALPPVNPVAATPPPINPIPKVTEINGSSAGTSRQQEYANAEKQFNTYLAAFKLKPGTSEFSYYGKPNVVKGGVGGNMGDTSASGMASANGGAANSAANKGTAKAATFVRAGTIIPAVLITPVNSDTPGPVLAEITSGPLAGARVLGSFRASTSQVVLNFTQISMLNQPSSFKIQAYAVDANTSSPGLATSVNHHYLLKYGLLAAAEFVSGYGQAVAQQGTTTVVSPLGGATVTNPGLSNSQIAKAALGQVGSHIGSEIQSESSQMRPTIKVQGAHGEGGIPIGLLFTSDF